MSIQGTTANKTGKLFETKIADFLRRKNLSVKTKGKELSYEKRDIKTGKGKSDLIILKDDKPFVRIECKFTKVAGSNYEKNYYPIVCSMKNVFTESYFILVLGGNWDVLYPNHINELKSFAKKTNAPIIILREGNELNNFIDELKNKYEI